MIWLPVTGFTLLLGFMIWIIFLANTGQPNMIFDLVNALPFGDKLGHLVLAGGLCVLLTASLRYKTLGTGSLKIYWGGILVLIVALAEEISQYFIPGRNFDVLDLAADLTGIIIAQRMIRYMRKEPSTEKYGQKLFKFLDRFKPNVKTSSIDTKVS